jgi:nicotinamidase-related amidase
LGAYAPARLTVMRLPADAVLIIIDAPEAIDPPQGAGEAQETRNIAALTAAWRTEGLPLVRVLRKPTDRSSPGAPTASPRDNELVIVHDAASAFIGADLEARLDELGATTLVFCGALAAHALEASVRHAGDLGYQVFVVADACHVAERADVKGRLWPAEEVRALSHANPRGEGARIVDVATTLRAAATAKTRQRRGAGRT